MGRICERVKEAQQQQQQQQDNWVENNKVKQRVILQVPNSVIGAGGGAWFLCCSRIRIWGFHCVAWVATVAQIPSLAQELPRAGGTAKKKTKQKKKQKSCKLSGENR